MNDDRLTPYCPVCETFVAGLIRLFDTRIESYPPTRIRWAFWDKEPELKRLAESSTRCQWCSLLDHAWNRRNSTGRRTGMIEISFKFIRNQQTQGLLGDIVTLRSDDSDLRATFYPTNMSLHVLHDNSTESYSNQGSQLTDQLQTTMPSHQRISRRY